MYFLIGLAIIIGASWIVVPIIDKKSQKKELKRIDEAADPNHELHEYWLKLKDLPDKEKIKMWYRIEHLYFMKKKGRP